MNCSHARSQRLTPAPVLALVFTLMVALVLTQLLGLMHAVVHGGTNGPAQAVLQARIASAAPAKMLHSSNLGHSSAQGWLAALFSKHQSHADCRLYDQAGHGNATLHVFALVLPVLLPSFAVALFQGPALARWAALFDARGPPLTR